jgi:acyl-CoA synthetase (AMP-forming)/AMP-acid ligase II
MPHQTKAPAATPAHQLLVGSIFVNAARAVPDRVAVALGDRVLTFGQLNAESNRLAAVLSELGLVGGDRLVTWAGTELGLAPLFAAAAKLGVVFAPANPTLSIEEAQRVLASARPSLLVVDESRLGAGTRLADQLEVPLMGLEALLQLGAGRSPTEPGVAPPGEDDPHVIFFTSGSTGAPKGAVLSHRVNFLRTHPGALLEPRGPMISPYPLFHMGAWTIALQQWQARDAVVLLASTDAASICSAIARHRAERLNCIPAVWRRILDYRSTPEGRDVDLSSIRFADTGTSSTPLELLAAIEEALPNAHIRVFYGSTEAGGVATLGHHDLHRKPGSCGAPAPFAEVRVADSGELLVRGPLVFDGYFENPAATASALADGWYHTGDLADLDEDGYLTITGRAGDVIRTGGESVVPLEIEQVVAEHPSVADVAVVGLPHPTWGEVVCAVMVIEPDQPCPTVEELRSLCQGRLAAYKHPRQVAVVDEIPRTLSTQQIQRRQLVAGLIADDARPVTS